MRYERKGGNRLVSIATTFCLGMASAEADVRELFGGAPPEVVIELEEASIIEGEGKSYLSITDGIAVTTTTRTISRRHDIRGELKSWDLKEGKLRNSIEFPTPISRVTGIKGNKRIVVLFGLMTDDRPIPSLRIIDLERGDFTDFNADNLDISATDDLDLAISDDQKSILIRQNERCFLSRIDFPRRAPERINAHEWARHKASNPRNDIKTHPPNWISRVGARDSRYALAETDEEGSAGVWRTDTWEKVIRLGRKTPSWRGWSPSSNGLHLISWTDTPGHGVALWDFEDFHIQWIDLPGFRPELAPALSADGRWLRYKRTGNPSEEIEIVSLDLELGTERVVHRLPPDPFEHYLDSRVRGTFSPNGDHLLLEIDSGEFLRFSWNASGEVTKKSVHFQEVHPVSISDDGVTAVFSKGTGGDTTFGLALVDLQTTRILTEWSAENALHIPNFSAVHDPSTGVAGFSHYTSGGSLGYYGGRVSLWNGKVTSNVRGYNLDDPDDQEFGQAWNLSFINQETTRFPLLAIYANNGRIQTWDPVNRRYLHRYEWEDFDSGLYAEGTKYPLHTRLFASGTGRAFLPLHQGGIRVVDLLPEGKVKRVADLWSLPNYGWCAIQPDGYYACSSGSEHHFFFRLGGEPHSFEPFDAHLNRPDLVCKSLGGSSAVISALAMSHENRLRTLGSTASAAALSVKDRPKIELVGNSPLTHDEENLFLTAKVDMPESALPVKIEVIVNGIPVHGRDGFAGPADLSSAVDLTIPLASGINRIQISARDARGVLSEARTMSVHRTTTTNPDLYLLTIGVGEYEDTEYISLPLARKDAVDVAAALTMRGSAFRSIHSQSLLNQEVTRDRILEAAAKFRLSRPDDQVIVFVSGHGELDTDLKYYFAPHDMKFGNPKEKGLSFDDLESLFEGIPARQRLLMLDTCRAGEQEYNPIPGNGSADGGDSAISSGQERNRSAAKLASPKRSLEDRLIEDFFVDLNRRNGITVLSASNSKGDALEHEQWNNGAFTSALLKTLEASDPEISASELSRKVHDTVVLMTGGRQRPGLRAVNLATDFPVATPLRSPANENPEMFLNRFTARSSSSEEENMDGLMSMFADEAEYFGKRLSNDEIRQQVEAFNSRYCMRNFILEQGIKSNSLSEEHAEIEFVRSFELAYSEEHTEKINKRAVTTTRTSEHVGLERLRIEIVQSPAGWKIVRIEGIK